MTALPTALHPTDATAAPISRNAVIGSVRIILLLEALATVALAVVLSLLAAAERDFLGGESGARAETFLRFAATGAFLLGVAAAIAARGVRRRRTWSWTTSAVVQLLVAVGTASAVVALPWHPGFLVGFAVPSLAMLLLCLPSVRRALGQE